MTPKQQQAAARIAVHQMKSSLLLLRQGGAAFASMSKDWPKKEWQDAYDKAADAIGVLVELTAACIDNAEQSDRVKE